MRRRRSRSSIRQVEVVAEVRVEARHEGSDDRGEQQRPVGRIGRQEQLAEGDPPCRRHHPGVPHLEFRCQDHLDVIDQELSQGAGVVGDAVFVGFRVHAVRDRRGQPVHLRPHPWVEPEGRRQPSTSSVAS